MDGSRNATAFLDMLFLHVPKRNSYSRSIGSFSFILYPPIGLLGLADYLRQNDLSSRILHLAVEEMLDSSCSVQTILDRYPASIVGLDLHWHFQAYDVIETARKIRQSHPEVSILLGGITASFFADEILREFPFIDFVIRGDAELPLRELILQRRSFQNYSTVPNLAYRAGDRVYKNPVTYVADTAMLERIRFTDFTLMENYRTYIDYFSRYIRLHSSQESLQSFLFAKHSSFPVFIGRGCAYDCSFCGGSHDVHIQIGSRTTTAVQSVESVLASIRDLVDFGFEFACLTSDCIPPHRADAFYVPILDGIAQEGLRIGIEVERNFLPSAQFLSSFSKLSCKDSFITLTLHTHNEHVRRVNHVHRYTNCELEAWLERAEALGVSTRVCFTCGLPFESQQDLEGMDRYQQSLRKRFKKVHLRTSMIEIEPGSGMSRNPEKYGVQPQRTTFLDYYRYHGRTDMNHWSVLGYDRAFCPREGEVKKFYCHHFCNRFGPGWVSPIVCKAFGTLRLAGLFPQADKLLSVIGRLQRAGERGGYADAAPVGRQEQ